VATTPPSSGQSVYNAGFHAGTAQSDPPYARPILRRQAFSLFSKQRYCFPKKFARFSISGANVTLPARLSSKKADFFG